MRMTNSVGEKFGAVAGDARQILQQLPQMATDRGLGPSRVAATASAAAKITTGIIAVSAAAAKMLVGMNEVTKSPNAGSGPASTLARSAAKPSATPSGTGKAARIAGVRKAAITAPPTRIAANVPNVSAAMRPACAARAMCIMPVITSEATSGTIVIWSALSHNVPMGLSTCSIQPSPPARRA